jgi:hypothetical protein
MSISSELTQHQETSSSLISPKLNMNTNAFLNYRQGINNSELSHHISALTRFSVKSITGNKAIDTVSEHKYLSVVVEDKVTRQTHNFFIERNTSTGTDSSNDSQVRVSASIATGGLLSAAVSIHASVTTVSNKGKELVATEDLHLPLLPVSPDVFGLFLTGKPVGLQVGVRHGSGTGCWRDTRGFTHAIA